MAVLADDGTDEEAIGAVFRAVHSIKGGAGAFGFERLVRFAHVFETVLEDLRARPGRLDRASHGLLMRAFDVLSDLVHAARDSRELPDAHEAAVAEALAAWHGEPSSAPGNPAEPSAAAASPADAMLRRFRIRFVPFPELLRKANEPLLLIRELKSFATVEIAVDAARVPPLESLEPELLYLAWELDVLTDADAARIAEVFEFVTDDCELVIEPVDDRGAALEGSPLAPADASAAAALHSASPGQQLPGADAPQANPAREPASRGGAAAAAASSIRVELEKIDRLVNMVGEIVITQAMLSQRVLALQVDRYPELAEGLEQMAQHTRELQECVMSIRAQPVKSVFARMPRLVRELAGELGKEVRVVASGETTEVDKTVIEQLSDPLTYMVRNSLDHGVEQPDERIACGKPREGTISLSAEHRGGRVVIEIADDGKGIDRERVRRKCVERGLVAAEAVLSDEEIDNFIFLPGFSTAERVSNISGRGVGMDVVKKNIQALGGRVHVTSTPGVGSRFTLSLPLTLAVLDGMVVTVGAERYIVPLTNILESLRPKPGDVSRLVDGGDVLAIRGEYVRLIQLARTFDVAGAIEDPTQALVVLVEGEGGTKFGLLVDEILGQQQVVMKTLEANYRRIEGVSAATILGDGQVALILDISGLRQIGPTGPPAAFTQHARAA